MQTSAESLASVHGGGSEGGEGGNPFELGLLRAESEVPRSASVLTLTLTLTLTSSYPKP